MAGLLGAGGQLILFKALRMAPAYLIFPLVALSPTVTILMATFIAREKATRRGWTGIALALVAGVLLSCSWEKSAGDAVSDKIWLILALIVFVAWGLQGFVLSRANRFMKVESVFFYMTVSAIALAPLAVWMTDFNRPVNWHFNGVGAATLIQLLNAVGALLLVYAFRFGKAIIVSPLTNAGAPVLSVVLSLIMFGSMPHPLNIAGIVLAVIATVLMSFE
jgi:drug/metabolite transporter (DMT)-like permease